MGFETTEFLKAIAHTDGYFDVEFIVPAAEADKIKDRELKTKSKLIQLKGFRRGCAPRELVQRHIGGEQAFNLTFAIYAEQKVLDAAKRRVLSTTNIEVKRDGVTRNVTVTMRVWLEPTVSLPDGIGANPSTWPEKTLVVPTVDPEPLWRERLRQFVAMNPYLQAKADAQGDPLPAADGDIVEVQIDAFIGSRRYDQGSEQATRITLAQGTVNPPSLYVRLLNAKAGDEFTLTVDKPEDVPRLFAQDVGTKTFSMKVKVLHVYTALPADDKDEGTLEELAVTAGYKNAADWQAALQASAKNHAARQEHIQKRQAVIDFLMTACQVPSFPMVWIAEKAAELRKIKHPLAASPTLEKDIEVIAQHNLLLRSVGEALAIPWDDAEKPTHIRDDGKYVDKVLTTIMARMFQHADAGAKEEGAGSAAQSNG